jgi:hypothetical protein
MYLPSTIREVTNNSEERPTEEQKNEIAFVNILVVMI